MTTLPRSVLTSKSADDTVDRTGRTPGVSLSGTFFGSMVAICARNSSVVYGRSCASHLLTSLSGGGLIQFSAHSSATSCASAAVGAAEAALVGGGSLVGSETPLDGSCPT